jgi:hypothetical protein
MPRKLLPALVLVLVLFSAVAVLADGDIYVGGPWGTRIVSLPYTITTPGAYYLGSNLTYPGTGDGIIVAAGVNHVTLDLMGFTLSGSGSGRYGIYLNGSKNVEIRNGTVIGWLLGIHEERGIGKLHRILNVRAVGNSVGIFLTGMGHLVKGCHVTAIGTNGAIWIKGTVSGCTVELENGSGITSTAGSIFNDNVVTSTGTFGYGIWAQGPGTLIKGNKVSGCAYGIICGSTGAPGTGVNVIGNTVNAANSATGIFLADDYSNLLDQNTVTGAGTHYNATYTKVYQRGTNF